MTRNGNLSEINRTRAIARASLLPRPSIPLGPRDRPPRPSHARARPPRPHFHTPRPPVEVQLDRVYLLAEDQISKEAMSMEDAVEWRLFDQTVIEVREAFADVPMADELENLIDEAVASVRKERRRERKRRSKR
jgi:hypothetical protein